LFISPYTDRISYFELLFHCFSLLCPPPQQCNTSESITDNQLSNSTFEDDLDANTIEALFNEIFNNTPQKSERFKTIPNDDIDNFIFQNENENTRL
jgi:hypothetical protein